MALDPIPNNGSQLERAVAAWLIHATKDNALGFRLKPDYFYFLNDNRARGVPKPDEPIITVTAPNSAPSAEFSGNREHTLEIELGFKAIVQPGATDPQFNRILIDRYIGLVEAAMSQTNNNQNLDATQDGITAQGIALKTSGINDKNDWRDAASNFDMDAFTCLFVNSEFNSLRGHPGEKSARDTTWWIEKRTWRITACPYAVS
jgi:hypothetical protein